MNNGELQKKHTGLWLGMNVEILFHDWPADHGTAPFWIAIFMVFTISVLAHIYSITPSTAKMVPKSLLQAAAVHAFRTFVIYLVSLCVITFNVYVIVALILGQLIGFLALTLYNHFHEPR